MPVDTCQCPLCGSANECAISQGQSTCWCFSRPIPDRVLANIPPELQQQACICRACAFGPRDPEALHARARDIIRRRG